MHHVDDPEHMSPEERATEVAAVLAAGILRKAATARALLLAAPRRHASRGRPIGRRVRARMDSRLSARRGRYLSIDKQDPRRAGCVHVERAAPADGGGERDRARLFSQRARRHASRGRPLGSGPLGEPDRIADRPARPRAALRPPHRPAQAGLPAARPRQLLRAPRLARARPPDSAAPRSQGNT